MRPSLPRAPGIPTRVQYLVDLAGGFERAGRLTGISKRTLNDWARDVRPVQPAQLAKLADGLGVDAYWIRTGEGEAPRRLNPVAVTFPLPPPVLASEVAPVVDLSAEVPVVSLGLPTIASLASDWATSMNLGGGAISVLSTDESATPIIQIGEPVLAAKVNDLRTALPLHPHAVWCVEVNGVIRFRRIQIDGNEAFLSTVSEPISSIKMPLEKLVIRGRAIWTGHKL